MILCLHVITRWARFYFREGCCCVFLGCWMFIKGSKVSGLKIISA